MKRIIFLSALAILCSPAVFAQNKPVADTVNTHNRFHIDDRVYAYFEKAEKTRNSEECLAYADTMLSLAVELGDKKGECIAYTMPISYYLRKRDVDKVVELAAMLRDVSRRNGYLQYYFHAYSQERVVYINDNRQLEALDVLTKIYNDAIELNYPFGVYEYYLGMAGFYDIRRSYKKSFEYYQKGAEYVLDSVPNQTPVTCYNQGSMLLVKDEQFEKAIEYADLGLAISTADMQSRVIFHDVKAMAYFCLDKNNEFVNECREIQAIQKEYGTKGFREPYSNILWDFYLGNRQSAIKDMEEKPYMNLCQKWVLIKHMYLHMGDYQSALKADEKLVAAFKADIASTTNADIESRNAQLNNFKLKMDNSQLELATEQSKRKRNLMIIGFIVVILLMIVAFVYITYRRHIQRINLENMQRYNFLVNVSHEFRTPLTLIKGPLTNMAGRHLNDAEDKPKINKMLLQADRMNTLLDTLITSANIQSGGRQLNKVPIMINEWAARCAQTFADEIESRGFSLSVAKDSTTGAILMDDSLCSIVFSNLMMDAIKKNNRNAPIKVTVSDRPERNAVRIAITAGGAVVSDAESGRLFEKMLGETSDKSGFSLGLVYSKSIVDGHGGTIGVFNNPDGSGATYWFELPILYNGRA